MATVAIHRCLLFIIPSIHLFWEATPDKVWSQASSRGPSRSSTLWRDRGLVQRRTQSLGELLGVVICPEMHEKYPWLLVKHVAVDGGNFDAVLAKCLNQRIDFLASDHEITGNGGLAAASRLEVNGIRRTHRRWYCHACFGDRIAPRNTELQDAAVHRPFTTQNLLDLRAVNFERRGWAGGGSRCGERRL